MIQHDQSDKSQYSQQDQSRQASTSYSPDPGKKRKRVSRACDACFAKKDRCDGAQPICRVCRDMDRQCTYDRPERKRGPLQGVRQRLEGQIELLESILGYLVNTFPGIQQDALKLLRLDDGEAIMMNVAQRGDIGNLGEGSNSRLPIGEIFPQFDKAYAKEFWRHSDFAKSIAPSIGLRLGLHDEEEDLIEPNIHRQRVEEAHRARSRLLNTFNQDPRFHPHPQHAQPYFTSPPQSQPSITSNHRLGPPLSSGVGPAYLPHSAAGQPGAFQFSNSNETFLKNGPSILSNEGKVHQAPFAHPFEGLTSSNASQITQSHSTPQRMDANETNQEDPFSTQWAHTSFDLSDLGEGAHALAYALGLPSASYGDTNETPSQRIAGDLTAMQTQMENPSAQVALAQHAFHL